MKGSVYFWVPEPLAQTIQESEADPGVSSASLVVPNMTVILKFETEAQT